jgi:hypothetical protein
LQQRFLANSKKSQALSAAKNPYAGIFAVVVIPRTKKIPEDGSFAYS